MHTGGLPRGDLLGRYRTYDDAQKVVDHLAQAEDFDIKAISIVGNDLRSVEHIRSRLSYPRVAGAGAAQGAMFGFFIGLLIWLFAPEAPVMNLALSVVLGMAIWMIIGVVSYGVRRGKRDFASSSQLVATTFDVVCDFASAGRARQLVGQSGVISLNAWNDPTGKSAELGGAHGPRQAPDPGEAARPSSAKADDGGSSSSQVQPESQQAASPASRAGYTDLPDGRPRFGVRRNMADDTEPTSAAASQPTEAQDAEDHSQGTRDAENRSHSDH